MKDEFKIVPITSKRIIDITGERYHRLVVLGLSDKKTKDKTNWVCECECGKKTIVRKDNLTNGITTSCGCYKREQLSRQVYKQNTTHGESHTRLYSIWASMKKRCNNPNDIGYSLYGGRGIKVCHEWADSYVAFADWARSNGYQDNLSIDRIDNDKGYEPSNCRWATDQEQAENTRHAVMIEYNGKTHTISEWSRIADIPRSTFSERYHRGDRGDRLFRPVEELFRPVRK